LWAVTLRPECELSIFENKELKYSALRVKKKKEALFDGELHNLYFSESCFGVVE
jgi:hypothetical protein